MRLGFLLQHLTLFAAVCVDRLFGEPAEPTSIFSLRMLPQEIFILDYTMMTQRMSQYPKIEDNTTSKNPDFNASRHNVSRYFKDINPMEHSNLQTECRVLDTERSYFNNFAIIMSRQIFVRDNTFYVTTTYGHSSNVSFTSMNRLETISIKYNATAIQEVKELEKRDIPTESVDSPNFIRCYQAQYISTFQEVVILCLKKMRETGSTYSSTGPKSKRRFS